MRILIVTDWNKGQGGAEAYITWFRHALIAEGDQVRLLTSSVGTKGDGAAEYVAYGATRVAAQALMQIANPFAVHRVREALSEFRPDIVVINMFAHHLSPAVLHALGDVPAVLTITDYKCVCPMGSKLRADGTICGSHSGWECHSAGCVSLAHWMRDQPRYALLRSGVARMDAIVSCSESVRRALAFEGIESECIILPVPAPPANYLRLPSEYPSFLFCGRLDIEKGVDVLIDAFADVVGKFPRAKLRIAGKGPEREKLIARTRERGIESSVSFPGWLTPQQLDPEFSSTWAVVAPSLWPEPLGVVALEAIVRGVPAIATATGGFSETVEQGVSGLLVANGDAAGLAAAMLAVAERKCFPDQRVLKQVVDRVSARHDVGAYTKRMREMFKGLTTAEHIAVSRTAS